MVKHSPASAGDVRDSGSIPGSGRSHWKRKWQSTPVFLPRESHGQRSLAGYSPRGPKESDRTEAISALSIHVIFITSPSSLSHLSSLENCFLLLFFKILLGGEIRVRMVIQFRAAIFSLYGREPHDQKFSDHFNFEKQFLSFS